MNLHDLEKLPNPTNRLNSAKPFTYEAYFWYNDELHQMQSRNRGLDICVAYNFAKQRTVVLSWTDVRLNARNAFHSKWVERILNRSWWSLRRMWEGGYIPEPYQARKPGKEPRYGRFWTEELILEAHAAFSVIKRGRPRKDGLPQADKTLPSRAEVKARMRQEEIMYVKDKDGNFVPTFQAKRFGV